MFHLFAQAQIQVGCGGIPPALEYIRWSVTVHKRRPAILERKAN